MKLKDVLKQLQELIEERPEVAEYEAVYSRDDEGNGYQTVYWTATVGHHDGEYHGEFYAEEHLNPEDMGDDDFDANEYPLNAVCIN